MSESLLKKVRDNTGLLLCGLSFVSTVAIPAIVYLYYKHNNINIAPYWLLSSRALIVLNNLADKTVRSDKKSIYDLIYTQYLQCGGIYVYRIKAQKMDKVFSDALIHRFGDIYQLVLSVIPQRSRTGSYQNMEVNLSLSIIFKGKNNAMVGVSRKIYMDYAWKPDCPILQEFKGNSKQQNNKPDRKKEHQLPALKPFNRKEGIEI